MVGWWTDNVIPAQMDGCSLRFSVWQQNNLRLLCFLYLQTEADCRGKFDLVLAHIFSAFTWTRLVGLVSSWVINVNRQPKTTPSKGQLISEWIYEDIVSPKIWTENCQDFCPHHTGQKSWQWYVRILGETMTS